MEARASSSYSSSGHLAGPGEVELRLEEQQTDWSFAGVPQGAPGHWGILWVILLVLVVILISIPMGVPLIWLIHLGTKLPA